LRNFSINEPFDDVSEVNCIVLPFGSLLLRRSRRHQRLSLDRENEWSTHMLVAVMGLTSSRDVTVSRTLST
jgi:hypothetical protein